MIKPSQPLQVKPPNLIQHFILPDLTQNFSPPTTASNPKILALAIASNFDPLQQKFLENS